jgi:hypothetical protein
MRRGFLLRFQEPVETTTPCTPVGAVLAGTETLTKAQGEGVDADLRTQSNRIIPELGGPVLRPLSGTETLTEVKGERERDENLRSTSRFCLPKS